MSAFRPSPPSDLTIPTEGSTTLRAILSMGLRKLFEDFKTLRAPSHASPAAKADYRALRQVLVGFLPGRPGAIASLLRRVEVSTALRCLRRGDLPPDSLISEFVGQSLFALELAGALDGPVEMKAPPPVLIAPLKDKHAPTSAPMTFGEGRATSPGAFHSIADDIVLSTFDNNPLRMEEAHPDKKGNVVSLGERSADEWVAVLRDALSLIADVLPDFRREIGLVLQQIVPVGYDEHTHLSASYGEARGTIYLTLHPNVLTMAEALIHEVSHNKLNALLELDPLLHNAFHPLYSSPVRPDPRPLQGVLLAVHAFLPVARLYEGLLARGEKVEGRFREVCRLNDEGAQVLAQHADATPVGQGVLDEMARWNAHFAGA
ncbi:MAG: HEXXH motif-containing putative peptide modification protein [Myxococcota bacterium]